MSADNAKITGMVTAISHDSGQPDDTLTFNVTYFVSGPVAGILNGEAIVHVDASQNDTQIGHDIRVGVAAWVDPLITPTQGFALADVRGCNV